jgi:hypothetical protein
LRAGFMNKAALPRRASGVILLALCAQVVTLNLGPCLLSCWRAGLETESHHHPGPTMPDPPGHQTQHMSGAQVAAPGQCHTVTLLVLPFAQPRFPVAPVLAVALVSADTPASLPLTSATPAFDTPPPRS